MKNISWYFNRLSKMSTSEVAYRVLHKINETTDKLFFQSAPPALPPTDQIISDAVFGLTQHVESSDLEDWANKNHIPLIDLAEKYCSNLVDVFGIEHKFGTQIDWHLDVKTGKRWPLIFWSDIDIRDGSTIGGAKFVWEANRLYGIPLLGLAYRATKQEKYAEQILSTLQHWLEENPYPLGVNWTSGIEIGTRVANLLWGLSFLQGYSFSENENDNIAHFLWLHGRHLYRYPSKYSSNNNHTIAEAFGLFLIGVFFPCFHEAEKWSSFGKRILERECGRQILKDGGSYECTTTYLSFVFDFFLLFKLTCEQQGILYDPIVDNRLERSCEFIHSLMDSEGNIPNIGDQDSAVLLNLGLNNHQNFQSILNTGAVLFNRPEFKCGNFPDFKTLILLGEKKMGNEQTSIQKKNGMFFWPESGLSVIRGTIADSEIVLVGNATPLGMPPLYAHGHQDAMSITLSFAGLDFLVDPGTYLYHSGGKWRDYFRSTAAHNTIRINKIDMTDMPGDFMFGKPYHITGHSLSAKGGNIQWQAGHDAYSHRQLPTSHNRIATYNEDTSSIKITDRLESPGKYFAEQFFHFHPECHVVLSGNHATCSRNGFSIKMLFDSSLTIKLYRGSNEPRLGWFSNRFNHLQETFTIACSSEKEGFSELITDIQLLTREGFYEN